MAGDSPSRADSHTLRAQIHRLERMACDLRIWPQRGANGDDCVQEVSRVQNPGVPRTRLVSYRRVGAPGWVRNFVTFSLLATGFSLISLLAVTLGRTFFNPPAPPARESEGPASASGQLEWQWCQDTSDPAIPSEKIAPVPTGT